MYLKPVVIIGRRGQGLVYYLYFGDNRISIPRGKWKKLDFRIIEFINSLIKYVFKDDIPKSLQKFMRYFVP